MVNIDRVYQTVLALANKEQRGYITPQEFNLFAAHAQNEIFDQYFYDLNQFERLPSTDSISNISALIEEKISHFYATTSLQQGTSGEDGALFWEFNLPSDVYTVDKIYTEGDINPLSGRWEVEIIPKAKAIEYALSGPLTRPMHQAPIGYVELNQLGDTPSKVHIKPTGIKHLVLNYIRRLNKALPPKWGYVVVNQKPLYASSRSTNFELHVSEEKSLIVKILQLAGVSIKDYGITQFAGQKEMTTVQQEKS